MFDALSGRRGREWLLVGLSLVTVLVVVRPLTELLVAAWAQQGLVFELVVWVANAIGGTVATIDAFLLGVLIAWLVLFALDEYKRVQAFLLLLVGVPAFLLSLQQLERWQFDWAPHLLPLAVGGIVGLATGVVGSSGRTRPVEGSTGSGPIGRLQFEFPWAGKLLYAVASLVAVGGLVERYVLAGWARGSGTPVTAGDAVIDLVVVATFVVLLNYFVEYTDRTEVAIVCRNRTNLLARIVGGLYTAAERYDARPIGDDRDAQQLARAAAARRPEDLPDLGGRIGFRYQPGGPLRRRTIVSADDPRGLDDENVRALEERASRSGLVAHASRLLERRATALLPAALAPTFTSAKPVKRIDESDAVLLVVSLSDFINEVKLDGELDDWRDAKKPNPPEDVDRYVAVQRAYDGQPTDVYLVAAEAELAQELHAKRSGGDRPSIEDGTLERFIANSVLDRSDADVTPVSRPLDGDSSGRGFEALLTKL
jgi:hypothetical protein